MVAPSVLVVRVRGLGEVDPTTGKRLPYISYRFGRGDRWWRKVSKFYQRYMAVKIKKKAAGKPSDDSDEKSKKLKVKKKKAKKSSDDDEDEDEKPAKKKKTGGASKDCWGFRADTRTSRINGAIIKSKKPLSVKQIEEKADAVSIYSHLSKLMSLELVKKDDDGKFEPTKKGRKLADK